MLETLNHQHQDKYTKLQAEHTTEDPSPQTMGTYNTTISQLTMKAQPACSATSVGTNYCSSRYNPKKHQMLYHICSDTCRITYNKWLLITRRYLICYTYFGCLIFTIKISSGGISNISGSSPPACKTRGRTSN